MRRLEATTLMFVLVGSLLLISLPFWAPPAWLAVTLGLSTTIIGTTLAALLYRSRPRRQPDPDEV